MRLRLIQTFRNDPSHLDAGSASLRQATGGTCAIANGKEVAQGCLQFTGELDTGGIELDLCAIEQRII